MDGSTISSLSLKLSPWKVAVVVAGGMGVGTSVFLAQSKHPAHSSHRGQPLSPARRGVSEPGIFLCVGGAEDNGFLGP